MVWIHTDLLWLPGSARHALTYRHTHTELLDIRFAFHLPARDSAMCFELAQEYANGKGALAVAEQLVQLKFIPYAAEKRDLVLLCLSDCWIGCDKSVPLRLKVHCAFLLSSVDTFVLQLQALPQPSAHTAPGQRVPGCCGA